MPNSNALVITDPIIYTQYNNLRSDVLDASTGHKHTGAANDGVQIILAGVDASKPAAASGNTGWLYFGTDTEILYRSNGTTWVAVGFTSPLTTHGDIIYRDGTKAARLAPGTSGQYLKSQGAGAAPVWTTLAIASTTLISVDDSNTNSDTYVTIATDTVPATAKLVSLILAVSTNIATTTGTGRWTYNGIVRVTVSGTATVTVSLGAAQVTGTGGAATALLELKRDAGLNTVYVDARCFYYTYD